MEIDDSNQNFPTSSSSTRIDQIISDYCRVQETASKEIDRKRRAVRSKCDERLWMAALWRDYQLDIVKKSFDSEIKQIEREHQSEFTNLKDSLLQELQEERKRLQAVEQASPTANLSIDRTGNLIAPDNTTNNSGNANMNDAMTAAFIAAEEQAAVASGRRLRRRDEKEKAELSVSGLPSASATNTTAGPLTTSAATTTASRRKQVNNIYTYNTILPEQEILDDLGAIAKEAGSLGTSRRAATVIKNSSVNNNSAVPSGSGEFAAASSMIASAVSSVNVSFDKGMLHYNWDIIGVSDPIKIQLSSASTAVNATVLACSATELVVSTGRSQIKISMADLKTGKVTIVTDDQLLHE